MEGAFATSPKATLMMAIWICVTIACSFVAASLADRHNEVERGMIGFIVGMLLGGALAGPLSDFIF